MSRWSWLILVLLVGMLALFVWMGVSAHSLPAVTANEQLPSNGELIYASMGGEPPVRVIRVEQCYIVQALDYRTWLVIDRGGWFGTEASIDCGVDARPQLP